MRTNDVGLAVSSSGKTESTCNKSELGLCSDVLSECPTLSEEIRPKAGYQLVMGSIATPHSTLKYLFNGDV